MKIGYGIKNFRVFDTNGTTFSLKPITILTGANCAGKSSLVKSLLLLKTFFEKCDVKDCRPETIPISFSDEKVYINGFDNALNNMCKNDKNVEFTISRKGLSDNVEYRMVMSFSSKESDILNDGWLNRIRFSCVIDGISDDFIDVSVTQEGQLSYDMLNLSGNIFRDFKRVLDIASYHWVFSECNGLAEQDYFTHNYPTQEDLDKLDSNFESLLKRIRENPLNRHLDLSCSPKYMWEFIEDRGRYERKLDIRSFGDIKTYGVRFDVLNSFIDSGILLNLPILNEIGKMSPAEFKEFIEGQKEFDYRCLSASEQILLNPENGHGSMYTLMDAVVQAFSQSGYSSFNEFYKKLESEALSDVGQLSANSFPYGDSFISNWRNFRMGFAYRGAGFVHEIETVINMLVYLGYTEYWPDASVLSGTVMARENVDFYYVYRVMTYLERKRHVTDEKKRYQTDLNCPQYEFKKDDLINWTDPREEDDIDYPESKVFVQYKRFISNILTEFLKSRDIASISSVGSFLCPVMRSYSFYDRSNPLSDILLDYFSVKKTFKKNRGDKFSPGFFINKWIRRADVGRAVDIDMNDDHTAFRIRIIDSNGKKYSSADYGHGVTQLLSILINIETAIIRNSAKSKKDSVTICFEEPEVSLHPSWQSMLAHIFRDAYDSYGIHFILETHSEYLTRATQAMVAQECMSLEDLKAFPFVVYYMEKNGYAYDLEYQLSGRFNRSFGPGFFDEASRSSLEILKREKRMRNE